MVSYSLHRAYAAFSTNPGSENAPVTSRRLIQIQAWISMATKLGAVRSLQPAKSVQTGRAASGRYRLS